MTGNDQDPLQDLVMNAEQVDRGKLASLLQGCVGIDVDEERFVFLAGVKRNATNRQLVALALLAQKALSLMVEDDLSDALSPSQVSEITGVAPGSVRPALKKLKDDGLARVREEGGYVVPTHALDHYEPLLEGIADD